MSLFEAYGQKQPQRQMTPQSAMQQLRQNPGATLKQAGFNVPDGMTDPREIAMHLMQSGQVGAQQMQVARQMMARMGLN